MRGSNIPFHRSAAKYALIFSLMGLVPSFGMLMHCPGVELGKNLYRELGTELIQRYKSPG